MNDFFLTCEYDPESMRSLKDCSVIFYSNGFSLLETLQEEAAIHNIRIHCVYIRTKISLSEVIYKEEWSRYPLAIESPAVGRIYEFLVKSPVIRKLNLRFYFSTTEPSCYKDVRILSSLGFSSVIKIDGEKTDWEQLADLMIYALLNKKNHAEIHPFNYVCKNYKPQIRLDFDSVYFNDPVRFLHVNDHGKVFPKKEALTDLSMCIGNMDSLHSLREQDAYKLLKNKWSEFFLEPNKCASCRGWRICLGKYSKYIDTNPGCEDFFSEFLDTIETEKNLHEKRNQQKELWQP